MADTNLSVAEPAETVSRRKLLRTSAGITITALGSAGRSAAFDLDASEFRRGQVRFLEVKEEFPDARDHPALGRGVSSFSPVRYFVDEQDKRLFLGKSSIEEPEDGAPVVSAGGSLQTSKGQFALSGSPSLVPAQTDFKYQQGSFFSPKPEVTSQSRVAGSRAEDRSPAEIAGPGRRGEILGDEVRIRGKTIDTSAGKQTARFEEPETPIANRNGKQPKLKQRVSIRDHGEVTVFGHEEYHVYPVGSTDEVAQSKVRRIEAIAGDHAYYVQEADVIAVPKDIESRIQKGDAP